MTSEIPRPKVRVAPRCKHGTPVGCCGMRCALRDARVIYRRTNCLPSVCPQYIAAE